MSKLKVYGLIGYPVKHSLSPAMHNAAFKELNIDAEYRLFEVRPQDLEDFLLKRNDIAGFNITIPHKVRAREILEEKFPFDKYSQDLQSNLLDVLISGAVNTVKRSGSKLEYWNTDAKGFIDSLTKDLDFDLNKGEYKNVIVFGCGGAGRAVICGLCWRQHRINKVYI